MTYDEQLQKLRDKNLQIRDEAAARDALRRIGYFSLITGYKDLFKNPTTKNYRDGTDLQDILSLYRFDEQLRELTLRYLLHIEQLIRSEISYAFCALFGEKQEAYLSTQNYCSKSGRCREIEILIQKHLRPLLDQRTDYPYIEHCKQRYGNVPLWVLVKALPFGTVSKMYALAKPQVQAAISRDIPCVNERQLGQMLQVLTVYRNVCAHGERLFSYRAARKDIPDLPIHAELGIARKGAQYLQGKRDYFGVAICFLYLLPAHEFRAYKESLAQLLEKAAGQNQQLEKDALLCSMGMPVHWEQMDLYAPH